MQISLYGFVGSLDEIVEEMLAGLSRALRVIHKDHSPLQVTQNAQVVVLSHFDQAMMFLKLGMRFEDLSHHRSDSERQPAYSGAYYCLH